MCSGGSTTASALLSTIPRRRTMSAVTRDRTGHEVHHADEVGHERRSRLAIDLERRADLLDRALVHHHDAVGHRERLFLVVGDHDRGDAQAALELPDLVAQVHAHLRVERGEGLVEQQEPRRGRQRARQRDPLLLAAGELGGVLVAVRGQTHQLEQLVDALDDLAARRARVLETVGDVPGGGQVREERVGLKDDADVAAVLLDAARGLDVEPGDRPEQGGLAAPGRAEEANELALDDLERDVVEGGEGAELLAEAADPEIRRRYPSPYFLGSDFAP